MHLERRRDIYRRWREAAEAAGVTPKAFLVRRLWTVRYRLGTSDADLVVPYTVGNEVRQLLTSALDELLNLYVSHNRDVLGDEVYDRVVLGSAGGAMAPLAHGSASLVPPEAYQAAGTDPWRFLPGLATPIVVRWWRPGGSGRRLVEQWTGWLKAAVSEGDATGEDTPLLLHLMLLSLFGEARRITSALGLPAPAAMELGAALLTGLHLSLTIAVAVGTDPGRGEMGPAALSGPRACFHPWPEALGLCRSAGLLPEDLVDLDGRIGTVPAGEPEDAWRSAVERLFARREGRTRLGRAVARAELAGRLAEAFSALPAGEVRSLLYELTRDLSRLESICSARRTRKALVHRLVEAGKAGPGNLRAVLERLAEAVDRFRPGRPDLKAAGGQEAVVDRVALALAVDRGDRLAAEVLGTLLPALQLRSGRETDRDLDFEYRRGRLYRLSGTGSPLLATSQPPPKAKVAHLFSDMKDFTLRTSQLKEEAMADFVRRSFYEPILALARRHYAGLKDLDDRGGVHLNNLLGDAISVSGDVVALLSLARDIRRHLTGYRRALRERLATMGDEALAAAELAAGTFVSYGAVPTVLRFEDPVWGVLTVSIAEGINESARGTGRSPAVRRLLETRLEALRQRLGRPGLQLPFRVYIAGSVGLPLEPQEEVAIQDALSRGDRGRALELYRSAAERFVLESGERVGRAAAAATGRGAEGDPGENDIYNAGEALSGGALAAYIRALGTEGFREARVSVDRLDATLGQSFAFLEPTLRLIVGVDGLGAIREIFRFAGRVTFKGFEATRPTDVWELVDPATPVHRLLARDPAVREGLRPVAVPVEMPPTCDGGDGV